MYDISEHVICRYNLKRMSQIIHFKSGYSDMFFFSHKKKAQNVVIFICNIFKKSAVLYLLEYLIYANLSKEHLVI